MIISFKCRDTQKLFEGMRVRRWIAIETVALRKLAMLNRAGDLDDLKIPPQNKPETLKKKRKGQHSICINDQWRLCLNGRKVASGRYKWLIIADRIESK